jgi:hypothetical protein
MEELIKIVREVIAASQVRDGAELFSLIFNKTYSPGKSSVNH